MNTTPNGQNPSASSNTTMPPASTVSPQATPPKPSTDIQVLLGEPARLVWWRRTWVWLPLLLLAIALVAIDFWQAQQERANKPVYLTETVARSDLTLTVVANGTLQPTRTVNIGSELSGTVRRVFVDVNDRVKKGQVLVELDTAKLQDQVTRSRAALAAAQAQLLLSEASVTEAASAYERLQEVARLSGGKVPAKAELDAGLAAQQRALATKASASANILSAKAALTTDETNLSKASIRSPIDGVVLTRTVDPGNAVAASLQAVTLFTVAEDLRELLLQVNVDEAEVGRVAAGQKASFTVSAFGARRYPASVTRVAFGSTINDNVVTYLTQLEVHNTDLSLRPGMSATSTIVATERKKVLTVPNKALRFKPRTGNEATAKGASTIMSTIIPRFPRGGRSKTVSGGRPGKQVWVLDQGTPVAVAVKAGITDGRMTEIVEGDLKEGMAVITEQRSQSAETATP